MPLPSLGTPLEAKDPDVVKLQKEITILETVIQPTQAFVYVENKSL